MGLVLEGKGTLVENNYISATYGVNLQYADSNYNFSTEVDNVTFRNNYVEDPINNTVLSFQGEIYNNTFNNDVAIKYAHTYNNTFNTVEIKNNVLFENNQ